MATPYQRAIEWLADQEQQDLPFHVGAGRELVCGAWEKTDDQVMADVRKELNRRQARASRDQVPVGCQA